MKRKNQISTGSRISYSRIISIIGIAIDNMTDGKIVVKCNTLYNRYKVGYVTFISSSSKKKTAIELLKTKVLQKHFGSLAASEHYHDPLTSALEACLCPAHPAPATRSKPSLEARSPSPEPPTPTISLAHIMPPESPLRSHTNTRTPDK